MIEDNKTDFFSYLNKVVSAEEKLCVKGNHYKFLEAFKKNQKGSNHKVLAEIIMHITESVTIGSLVYIEIREIIGRSYHYLFNVEEVAYEKITSKDYLIAKEKYVKTRSG